MQQNKRLNLFYTMFKSIKRSSTLCEGNMAHISIISNIIISSHKHIIDSKSSYSIFMYSLTNKKNIQLSFNKMKQQTQKCKKSKLLPVINTTK